jgi:uncharacterized protein
VNETFESVLRRRLTRRGLLRGGALAGTGLLLPTIGALAGSSFGEQPDAAPAGTPRRDPLGFRPISGSRADAVRVPEGYDAQLLARWGDALFDGEPSLDTAGLAGGSLIAPGAATA